MPRVSRTSLTDTGTPSRRPFGSPRAQRASLARAASSAPSASRRQYAFSAPFSASIRASADRVASTGDRVLVR